LNRFGPARDLSTAKPAAPSGGGDWSG